MADHAPAELDRLELLLLRAQRGRLLLEPPRGVHEGGMGRVHQAERGVIGRAGERLHDGSQWSGVVGECRHSRRLAGARLICPREIDPDQALPLDARIGAAADLGEVHLLALAQRRNLDAGAGHVEAPAVIAARDGVAVEVAVMQRDAAVRAVVAQREHPIAAAAADDQRLAEQGLVNHAARPQLGARERDVPKTAQQFGLEVLHGRVPEMPAPAGLVVTPASAASLCPWACRPPASACNASARDDVSDG